mgnify:CR=1 FL=1
MSNHLHIQSVSLSRRQRSRPDVVDGHREVSFNVSILVQNQGDVALHVVNELRTLDYDAASTTLTLGLREPLPAPAQKYGPTLHLSTPRTELIKPHASATLVVSIPAELKQMKRNADFNLVMERTDLTLARTIRCEVAASPQTLEARSQESVHALRTRLVQWGHVARVETAVTLDAHG